MLQDRSKHIVTILSLITFTFAFGCDPNDGVPVQISQYGTYNVISFVSFNSSMNNPISEQLLRFHMRVRYMAARELQSYRILKTKNNCQTPVGFIAYNVCGSHDKLTSSLLQILIGTRFYYQDGDQSKSNIIAVVSFMPMSLTVLTGQLLKASKYDIPFLAYTEEKGYDNVLGLSTYNLINREIEQAIQEIQYTKTTHVLLLLIENDLINQIPRYHQNLIWQKMVDLESVSVTKWILNMQNVSEIYKVVDTLKYDKQIDTVIVWSDFDSRDRFIKYVDGIDDRLWYWYSETSFNLFFQHNISLPSLVTHMFHNNPLFAYQSLNRKYTFSDMQNFIYVQQLYDWVVNDPWFNLYRKYHPNSTLEKLDISTSMRSEVSQAIILPIWWSQAVRRLCHFRWPLSRVRSHIDRLSSGVLYRVLKSGRLISIRSKTPISELNRIRKQNDGFYNRKSCLPGYESYMKTTEVSPVRTSFAWKCIPCEPGYAKSSHSNHSCKACTQYFVPNADKTFCIDPYTNYYLNFDRHSIYIFIFCNGTVSLFLCIALVIFIVKRDTPLLRSSDLPLTLTQICAHLIVSINLPLTFIGKPTVSKCIPMFSATGSFLIFANTITLTRSHKFVYIFKQMRRLSQNHVKKTQTMHYSSLVFFQLLYIVSCVFISWSQNEWIKETIYPETKRREIYCNVTIQMKGLNCYLMLIVLGSFIQCFRARKLPKNLNESKRILYSSFLKFVLLAVHFPIWYGQKTDLDRASVRLFALALFNAFDVIFKIGYMVFIVYFRADRNTKESFRKEIFDSIRSR